MIAETPSMRRAIIVGASSGIGWELARVLIREGWMVGVAARRANLLQQLVALCPQRVHPLQLDVIQEDAPQRLSRFIEKMGGIDLYVHSSGIGKQNRLLDTDIEAGTARTNAVGFIALVSTVFNYMAKHGGGHIAVISSIAGTKGLGAAPAYSATKALQNTYMQALEQLIRARKLKIRLTDLRPGFVDTAILSDEHRYPMLMRPDMVAEKMWQAIRKHRHVCVIDGRWRLLTALWRLIPNGIWRRLPL